MSRPTPAFEAGRAYLDLQNRARAERRGTPLDDGVEYLTETATSRMIRDQAIYSGVRIARDCGIATAAVKFRLDVNFGEEPVQVLGYPLETVLAEKISTPIHRYLTATQGQAMIPTNLGVRS